MTNKGKLIPRSPNQPMLAEIKEDNFFLPAKKSWDRRKLDSWLLPAVKIAPPMPNRRLNKNQGCNSFQGAVSRSRGKNTKQTISRASQIPRQTKKSFLARSFIAARNMGKACIRATDATHSTVLSPVSIRLSCFVR